jgi:iron complex outermembrane receptor protein
MTNVTNVNELLVFKWSYQMKRKIFSVVSLVLLSSLVTAQAQEQKAEETKQETNSDKKSEKKKEVIRVTGSRIKQIDVESSSPVVTYSKEDIDRSGLATVSDFIRNRIPSGGMTTENETLQQSAGGASFGGRDFDPQYTLVLVNGRRLPTNAIADDYVDLNLIPLAAVERIEYLTDGASAIYGSDAVAGVLNIITRKQFTGTSVVARMGQNAKHKDGTETSLQVVSGASGDKGNFLIAADIFKREGVSAKDRPLIKSAISPDGDDGRSPTGLPGFVIRNQGTGTSVTSETRTFTDCPEASKGDDGRCYYDIAPLYQAIPKTERQSIYTVFDNQLTESVNFFGEARFSRSSTDIRNGAAPGQIRLTAAQWNALPQEVKALSPFFDPNDPNKVEADDVSYRIGRRFLEFGPRATSNYNESFNLIGGLTGSFNDINWEFAATRHQLKNIQFGVGGNIDSSKVIGYFQDGTFNPFVLNEFDTEAKVQAKDDVETEIFRLGESRLETYSLAFDGELPVQLGGGKVGWAAGAEYRQESYFDQSDSVSQSGVIAGSAGGVGGGGQDTTAGYVEFSLPIIPKLELRTAVRNDSIANSRGEAKAKSATTYKAGVSYPLVDSVKVRASYGTGFKAAPLHDRFLQISEGVEFAVDKVYCQTQGIPDDQCDEREVNSRSTGNTDLDPERSTYYNFGVVVQPITPVSVSLDYWNLVIKDKIGSLGTQYLLNNEDKYPDFIKRSPFGTLDEDGYYVESRLLNLNKNESSGVEVNIRYDEDFGFAKLASGLRLSKVLASKTQETPTDPLCDTAKYVSGPNGSLTADLLTKVYSVGASVRYDSAYDTHTGGYTPGTCDFADPASNYHVKSYAEYGLNAGYVAPFGTEFGIGVQNLADAKPAYDRNATWPWYNQQAHSNMGRYVYATIAHKFE